MKLYTYILVLTLVSLISCNDDFLEVEPTNLISADAIFSSPEGVKAFMANLYSQMPIEDFNSTPDHGIRYNASANPNNAGFYPWIIADDAVGSEFHVLNYQKDFGDQFAWWIEGYELNRDVNLLLSVIPDLDADQSTIDALLGEAYFIRAYLYFGLAKRYGGVPIIETIASISDGEDALYTPRSTEKETWEYVLKMCDESAALLGDGDGTRRRANKWVALSLKSRAALHAASIAKHWDRATLSGDAVDQNLSKMSAEDAAWFYEQCISASEQIINNDTYSLYQPAPSNADEAATNYKEMFEDPNRALVEAIFIKGSTLPGITFGSNQDNWGNPAQTTGAWPHPGRFGPTLDLVDVYENYATPGQSTPVVTTVDGITDNYDGYQPARNYLEFDHPADIFADKDARLRATVILPRTFWKDTEIIIQGGLIRPDGSIIIDAPGQINVGGTNYYSYGASAPNLYSGFSTFGGNMTKTGFGFKKFLQEDYTPILAWNQSVTDWMDFRLAEIYLNYAEAVVESGTGDQTLAGQLINDLRRRAAHTTTIPLTLENVLRERRVELVFENHRVWDLIRTRTYHTEFEQRDRHALIPIFDTRSMKYIFVRDEVPRTAPQTYPDFAYYKRIPGVATNKLVQNPQY